MLTRMDKSILRRDVHFFEFTHVPIYASTLKHLEEEAFSTIRNMGFQYIRRSSPTFANTIIRIFWQHIEKDQYLIGYDTYTIRYDEWVTLSNQEFERINFSKNFKKCCINGEQLYDGPTDFYDIYLIIGMHK